MALKALEVDGSVRNGRTPNNKKGFSLAVLVGGSLYPPSWPDSMLQPRHGKQMVQCTSAVLAMRDFPFALFAAASQDRGCVGARANMVAAGQRTWGFYPGDVSSPIWGT